MTNGPKVDYRRLQEIRQSQIAAAVTDPATKVERLVNLFGVARQGVRLANKYGATESDALTFMGLENDLRQRLSEAPPNEVIDCVARLALQANDLILPASELSA